MAEWREAPSLLQLEREIQEHYPGTTTWEIGDEAHQATWSDHNPNECCDVVCAKDVLGNAGLSLPSFVSHLIANPHPNLRYVIYARVIYKRSNGFKPEEYDGINAHQSHAHVSVGNGPDGRSTSGYSSTASWGIANLGKKPTQPPTPSKPSTGTSKLGSKMPTLRRGSKGRNVQILQALLGVWGWKVSVDGIFGPQTEKALKAFQAKYAKPSDGIAGPITWNALLNQ